MGLIGLVISAGFWYLISSWLKDWPKLLIAVAIVGLVMSAARYKSAIEVSKRLQIPSPDPINTVAVTIAAHLIIACVMMLIWRWTHRKRSAT